MQIARQLSTVGRFVMVCSKITIEVNDSNVHKKAKLLPVNHNIHPPFHIQPILFSLRERPKCSPTHTCVDIYIQNVLQNAGPWNRFLLSNILLLRCGDFHLRFHIYTPGLTERQTKHRRPPMFRRRSTCFLSKTGHRSHPSSGWVGRSREARRQ